MTEHLVTEVERRGRTRTPTHPGAVIREDIIPALGTNVSKLARELKVSRQTLHGIIRAENPNPVTAAMAVRLARRLGRGPEIWLNMQAAYDLWHAARTVDVSDIPTEAA